MRPHLQPLEPRTLLSFGSLDPTFGTGGRSSVSFGDRSVDTVFASLVQPDGKVLLVGSTNSPTSPGTDFAVARLNPDASLDQTFGVTLAGGRGGGLFELDLPASNADAFYGAVLQPDGKILLVGTLGNAAQSQFGDASFGIAVVVRLNPDGTPDGSFGANLPAGQLGGAGVVFLGFDPGDPAFDTEARAVALQSDGKIIVAGSADNSTRPTYAFARLLPENGALDTSFGLSGTGIEKTNLDDDTSGLSLAGAVFGLAVDSFDRIYLTGTALILPNENFPTLTGLVGVARLTRDGLDDISFGDEGVKFLLYDFDPSTQISLAFGSSIKLRPDGRVLVSGFIARSDALTEETRVGIALAQFTSNGDIDTTFGGGDGQAEIYFGRNPEFPSAAIAGNQLTLLPDGRFFTAGFAASRLPDGSYGSYTDSIIAFFRPDGTLDPSFNRNGLLYLTASGGQLVPQSTGNVQGGFLDLTRSAGAVLANIPDAGIVGFRTSGDGVDAFRLIAAGPDLTVSVVSVRAVPAAGVLGGTKSSLSIRFNNQGNERLTGTVPVTLRLSRDRAFSDDDLPVANLAARLTLLPNAARNLTLSFTYPVGELSGQFFLVARVNQGKVVSEANVINNLAAAPSAVSLRPAFVELTGELVAVPASVADGKTGLFSVRLVNSGTLPAKGRISLQLLASTDDTESAGDLPLLAARPTSISLSPGQRTLRLPGTVPLNTAAGTYRLILKLDATSLNAKNPSKTVVSTLTLSVV